MTNEIDLESEGSLEALMVRWCNLIDPKEFAAVMSALRDCDDDFRRNEIIDNMIGFAFRESPERAESEHLWRKRFEARLKCQIDRG